MSFVDQSLGEMRRDTCRPLSQTIKRALREQDANGEEKVTLQLLMGMIIGKALMGMIIREEIKLIGRMWQRRRQITRMKMMTRTRTTRLVRSLADMRISAT
jgi:hypothetical protein